MYKRKKNIGLEDQRKKVQITDSQVNQNLSIYSGVIDRNKFIYSNGLFDLSLCLVKPG